jgi:4-carboxymuconolactone decarboxylase
MNLFAAALAVFSIAATAEAQEQRTRAPRIAPADVWNTVPALGAYTDEVLFADVWKRAELAPRDRSLVTISALIAGGRTEQLTSHLNRALDNGVTPAEAREVITHLAFYSGWPNAISAVRVAKDVFDKRGISAGQAESTEKLPLDEAGEARRAASVEATAGRVLPGLAGYTNSVVFGDLWRRPDLTPRDRSLVTITALVANGQAEQLPFHAKRGMENGLTPTEIAEAVTHLAFYAGWPRAFSAVPVLQKIADEQPASSPQPDAAERLTVQRHGAAPPMAGPSANFTGQVSVSDRFQRQAPARLGGATVAFEPGARTAWHTHPLGQTLIVTAGCGWVQREGGPVEEIRPGDVVLIAPGEKHWHGASATSGMTHIAIAEQLDGKVVDWMEHVTDEDYRAGLRAGAAC